MGDDGMMTHGPSAERAVTEQTDRMLRPKALAFAVAAALAASNEQVLAQTLPTGGQVVGGNSQATISQPNANTLQIDQYVSRSIINWTTFSIGSGQSVVFRQPDASSVSLNRVKIGRAHV